MKVAVKELLADRRNGMFSWWQTLLVAPIMGFVYWLFVSGFRRFRDEDVTPR
ncbi:hypothetical protein [Brevibacterium aurantiacum]|uniref:Uncharacterized protein n=1 Tax=Brevibacterium aurantiacum TaxID=273384 RepID=A0A2H1JAJ7_BREAU|nr:hypothetical protein [Brevibacterium aurantiacum]GEB24495.1 hypothetical protein BAU01nite_32280 [Brevibacterium aurantiacum]SMX84510.1 hypothetical protein BAUR9175_02243 [Brevibacterium aurantiacum]